jgi:transcriptional regulator with XRE-family HTH domain
MTDRLDDYPSLERQLLHEFPDLKALWDKTHLERLVGILFSRMRKVAGMSQRDVAEIAGWDKAFISRLEGIEGGVPDLKTISRYADACNMNVGIVVCSRPGDAGYVRIIDAISLNSAAPSNAEGTVSLFDTLRDREIEIK